MEIKFREQCAFFLFCERQSPNGRLALGRQPVPDHMLQLYESRQVGLNYNVNVRRRTGRSNSSQVGNVLT
jgi:hypothetical protein